MNENDVKVQNERRKVVLSGIQPTGVITLGNYVGAVSNWDKMQDEYDSIFFIYICHINYRFCCNKIKIFDN